jgi:drug/metabolite transporter (DMT)-like permease
VTDAAATAARRRWDRVPPHARGQLAVAGAALAWSTAGVVQRGLDVSAATQVAGRAMFAAVALLGLVALMERRGTWTAFRSMGRAELGFAACAAVSSGTFMLALNYTTVATVLFMQALAPLLAALIARVALGERVAGRTWSAMAIALGGVTLMVGGPDAPSASGQLLAFLVTVSFAGGIVIARHRRDVSMAPATCVSQLAVLAVALPFVETAGLSGHEITLLAFLGICQIGLGLGLLTVGARLIPPAEVALITLLEVVLGPLWVWLAYDEQPGTSTVVGGLVVLLAVAVQAAGDLRRPGRLAQAAASAPAGEDP